MTPFAFVLLGLAAWRWTRLVVNDEIARPLREAAFAWATPRDGKMTGSETDEHGQVSALIELRPPSRLRLAAVYLIGCPHCVGVWAAAGLVLVYIHGPAWLWDATVVTPAVAAVVSLLALLLPED